MTLNSTKKIVILCPDLRSGGAEKIAVNLANYFSCAGFNVELVLFYRRGPYLSLLHSNVNVSSLDFDNSNIFKRLIKLAKLLREKRQSAILSVLRDSNIYAGISNIFVKNKNLFFREANTLDGPKSFPILKRTIYMVIMKLSYMNVNKVICNSIDTRDDLINNNISSNIKNLVVIGNPVLPEDYLRLADEAYYHKWLSHTNYKTILNVGRLHRQKDQAQLLSIFSEVLKRNSNARLIIVGEGDLYEKLMERAMKLNVEKFIDIIPYTSNLYPIYKQCRVFALTSLWEGFGNVIVEALSMGKQVICYDCPGGPKSILDDGKFGVLIKQGNNEGYIEALIKLLDADVFSTELSIERANRYTIKSIANSYAKVMGL